MLIWFPHWSEASSIGTRTSVYCPENVSHVDVISGFVVVVYIKSRKVQNVQYYYIPTNQRALSASYTGTRRVRAWRALRYCSSTQVLDAVVSFGSDSDDATIPW